MVYKFVSYDIPSSVVFHLIFFCCVTVKTIYKTETLYSCYTHDMSTVTHDMSTVSFPWQHNGSQALSIQRVKSEFPSFMKYSLLIVYSVGVSEYRHYTTQSQESSLDNEATNKAFFILGR